MSRSADALQQIRDDVTPIIRELNNEALAARLLELLDLMPVTLQFAVTEGAPSSVLATLTQARARVEELKELCRNEFPRMQLIRDKLLALFGQVPGKSLWPQEIYISGDDLAAANRFRAESTVIWKEFNRRFGPRKKKHRE